MKERYFTAHRLALLGMLSAIILILGLTPLGFIPIPPLGATLTHLPTILAGILGGPIAGAIMGLLFGLTSIYSAIVNPQLLSVLFYNPLVSIVPRILVGLVAAWTYALFARIFKADKNRLRVGTAASISAICGTATNTILVLGMIYLLYAQRYADALEMPRGAVVGSLLGIAGMQGIPEALIAAAVTVPVVLGVQWISPRLFQKSKRGNTP